MRRFFTAVLEQGNVYEADFETEPYEAGWASEARWFIRILEAEGAADIGIQPEISPDGLVWLADGSTPLALPGATGSVATCAQREFGNWLRLKVTLGAGERSGAPRRVKFLIYLALKE